MIRDRCFEKQSVGGNFLPPCMAGMRDIAVARRGEHPAHAHGAHSAGAPALAQVVPSGAQTHAGAYATVCELCATRQLL